MANKRPLETSDSIQPRKKQKLDANNKSNLTVMYDCVFTVGPDGHSEDIPAIKAFMRVKSPVFQSTLHGAFTEFKENNIRIPDMTLEAFAFTVDFCIPDLMTN